MAVLSKALYTYPQMLGWAHPLKKTTTENNKVNPKNGFIMLPKKMINVKLYEKHMV